MSRSPVTTSTGTPCWVACATSVAMTSSASWPGTSTTRTRRASSTSRMSGIWELNSLGVVWRLALYSGYTS